MTYRQQFGVLALLIILVAVMASGPEGGGDGPVGTADTPVATVRPPPPIVVRATSDATPSAEQEIRRTANRWAPLFAAASTPACTKYMAQPACEQVACERVPNRKIPECTPLSPLVQKSFEDAKVQEVVIPINGARVAAKFSNGQVVELSGIRPPGQNEWAILKVGGNAGHGLSE